MHQTSITGVFCEDIREEKSGNITLIGIIPDNAEVPNVPALMPKLCVYIRIHFDPSQDIGPLSHTITLMDGTILKGGGADATVVAKAKSDAKESGAPLAAVFSRIEMSPFVVTTLGRVKVETMVGESSYLACALNFKQAAGQPS